MKVVIIGAGAVGSVIAKELAKERVVSRIICGAYDLIEAKKFISETDKIKILEVNALDIGSIVKISKGAKLIINASFPDFNLNIMKAALKVKANYQDLCSLLQDFKTAEQLSLDKKFKKAGLVALINTGVAPGVTNLFAKIAANSLDDISDIKIRLIEDLDSKKMIMSWCPKVVLDELAAPPLAYRDGKFVLLKPLKDPEVYHFPKLGKRKLVNLYGDEVATIPLYIRLRNLDFKSGGSEIAAAMRICGTNKLRMLEKVKVPTPQEMDELLSMGIVKNALFVSTVEGIGKKDGKETTVKITAIYPDLRKISKKLKGATYISYPTGIAAVAFARVIPKIKTSGVFPPEALDSRFHNEILSYLKRKHVSIITQDSSRIFNMFTQLFL